MTTNKQSQSKSNLAEQKRGDEMAAPTPAPAPKGPDTETPNVPVFPDSANPQQPIGTRPIGNEDNETPAMKIERERAEQDEAIRQSQEQARQRTEAESTPRK